MPSVCRDHNATSYSTETFQFYVRNGKLSCRDHNATSYSTETRVTRLSRLLDRAEIITLRAIALKPNTAVKALRGEMQRS